MSLGHDPAYTDLLHDEHLALRDRRDDHAPAVCPACSAPMVNHADCWLARSNARRDAFEDAFPTYTARVTDPEPLDGYEALGLPHPDFTERPSDRERKQHHQERAARDALRPRTGFVSVQPLNDDGGSVLEHRTAA